MKKILLIAMVCCIVTATAVFASTQTNLVSSKSCTKRYPWTLYNKTTKKCVCPTGMKRKRKTRCDIVTSIQWTWSIKTWGIVSTSSLLSTGSKPVFASWFNTTWSTVSWTIATGGAMLNWIWTNPNNGSMFWNSTQEQQWNTWSAIKSDADKIIEYLEKEKQLKKDEYQNCLRNCLNKCFPSCSPGHIYWYKDNNALLWTTCANACSQ